MVYIIQIIQKPGRFRLMLFAMLVILITYGCTLTIAHAPTPEKLIDSFFFGHALIDANGNGTADDGDAPIEGAIFSATDARGASSGGYTDKDGSSFAWWSGESQYPVTLHMEPPPGSNLVVIGSGDVILENGNTSAQFLFAITTTVYDQQDQ